MSEGENGIVGEDQDGRSPLISDSEDDNGGMQVDGNVSSQATLSQVQESTGNDALPVNGNPWEWFIVQESFLSSINIPTDAKDTLVLSTLKNSLEEIIQCTYSKQTALEEDSHYDIFGMNRVSFITTRWEQFIESLSLKYSQLIKLLYLHMYDGVLKDTLVLIEEGQRTLTEYQENSHQSFMENIRALTTMREVIEKLHPNNDLLRTIAPPIHLSVVKQDLGVGTPCSMLYILEDEDHEEELNDGQEPSEHSLAMDIVHTAENTLLECSDLIEKLNGVLEPLLTSELQNIYKSFEELELLLTESKRLSMEEPQRMMDSKTNPPSLIASSTGDEIEDVEDDTVHPELMVQSSSQSDPSEADESQASPLLPGSSPTVSNVVSNGSSSSPPLHIYDDVCTHSPGLPPPVFSSDDDEDATSPSTDHPPDIDPNDQDYISKVEQHIFSPEAVKAQDKPAPIDDSADQSISEVIVTSSEVTDLDNMNGSITIPSDPEITPTHNATSVNVSEDTLLVPTKQDEEYSPIDVGSELYNLNKTLEDDPVDNIDDDIQEEITDDEGDDDPGSKFDSEEGEGSSRTDDSNVEWIKSITVFEYRLSKSDLLCSSGSGGSGRRGPPSDDDELMTYGMLINDLEVKASSFPSKTDLKDELVLQIAQLKGCLVPEHSQRLSARLNKLLQEWEVIETMLLERICQLKFEWSQMELILWFHETVSELQQSPSYLLLPEEMQQSLEAFIEYFEEVDQIGNGENLVIAVRESVEALQQYDKNEERFKRVLGRLEEAYEVICDKMSDQREFLQYGIDQWRLLNHCSNPLTKWFEAVEQEIICKSSYGNSLDQSEQFMRLIVSYRQDLPQQYELLKDVVATGNELATLVADGSPAHKHIDTIVRGTTVRWQELVKSLKLMEEDLSNVLITWQEYVELYSAARDFIDHINKIAGRDAVKSSFGDEKLLPKFVLQTEVNNFQSRMSRLKLVKDQLLQNPKVDVKMTLANDMARLETEWMSVEDVARGSLDTLWAEHSAWINIMLGKMEDLFTKGQDILERQQNFVSSYPLDELMTCNTEGLLKQLQDILTTYDDQLFDMREAMFKLHDVVREREHKIREVTNDSRSLSEDKIKAATDRWNELETACTNLNPILQLYCSQLNLVCPLRSIVSTIDNMEKVAGSRDVLTKTLSKSELIFSIAKFETLKQLSYDLDTVYREQYMISDKIEGFPSNQKLQAVNQEFAEMIPKLEKQSQELHGHLVLMVEWWKDYEEGHKIIGEWLVDVKARINDLSQQTLNQEANPHELLEVAEEVMADVQSHESQFNSLTCTAQNLLVDMESKQCEVAEFANELTELKSCWSDIQTVVTNLTTQLQQECSDLNTYLEKLGYFSERLNSVYAEFYDELCTAIPPNASQETINRQKQILEKFNDEIAKMSDEFHALKKEGERWGSKSLPVKWMEEFRELSPGVDDSSSDSSHQSVDRQLSTSENRLKRMNQMLKDRALDLELTQGDTATLLRSANELLEWVEDNLGQDLLHERPPGELDQLLQNSEGIKNVRESFESRRRTLQRLHEIATSSKGALSEKNLIKIEQLMAQLDSAWEKLDESLAVTESDTEDVLAKVQEFHSLHDEYCEWLITSEQTLKDCLPIEANSTKLEKQQIILEALNNEVLEHKRTPEELGVQAEVILELSQTGTGQELLEKAKHIQKRFEYLEDEGAESSELIEEAKNDIQSFEVLDKEFTELISALKGSFEALKSKPKKPIGNVQETIDEQMDYCSDVESKNTVYNKMYGFGHKMVRRYPPSKEFSDELDRKKEEWDSFVTSIVSRWDHYLHMNKLWKEFESTVKDFLEWLMAEGKSFSKDVTTLGGEKGVCDHMKTCETLKNALDAKGSLLDEIMVKADKLQEEDGKKPNGTRDVDSRLNDVTIHWNSVCQLLSETLVTLDGVYKKLTLINKITDSEREWLEKMDGLMSNKRTTHGDIDVLTNEVDLFKQYLQEFDEHKLCVVMIAETEKFVLEHSSCHDHEDIKRTVKDTINCFETLEESATEYLSRIEKSIPLWEKFNEQKAFLSKWLRKSQQKYDDNELKSGNAMVTKKSLENTEKLNEEIQLNFENVQLLNELMNELSGLCEEGDKDFIFDHTNSITEHANELKETTESHKDLLESRMESWRLFPMEAAVEVQEFIEAVSKEVDVEDDDFAEGNAEELLLKLQRLEVLHKEHSKRRRSASSLDLSGSSEEIKKALEKNPDISEERTTLLRGWSSTSLQLTSKLELLRLKAEMAVSIEKHIKGCTTVLGSYQNHISTPFPHSVALLRMNVQWQETERDLRRECVEAAYDLQETFEHYNDDERIKVPKKLEDQVKELLINNEKLLSKGSETIRHITSRLQEWKTFQQSVESLTDWLEGTHAEMDDISRYYVYLQSFQDILDRHQLVQNQIKAKTKTYHTLQQNHPRHLVIDRKPSLEAPMIVRMVRASTSSENSNLGDEGEGLEVDKEQEEFIQEDNVNEQSEQVTLDKPSSDMEPQEDNQADVKGHEEDDIDFIQYQSKWTGLEQLWNNLNVKMDEFSMGKDPWEKIANLYTELSEIKEDIEDRQGVNAKRGEEIFRLGTNPGPLTEAYKQLGQELSSNNQRLADLNNLIETNVTQKLLSSHLPVREFVTLTEKLQNEWTQLITSVDECTSHAIEKMKAWESKATDCIRRVPILQNEINGKTVHIKDLEDQIGQLQSQPQTVIVSSPKPNLVCRVLRSLFVLIVFMFIPFLIGSILFIFLLDDGTKYHFFYYLQKLNFLELSPDHSSYNLVL